MGRGRLGSGPRRGGGPPRTAVAVAFQFRLSPVRRQFRKPASLGDGRALGQAPRGRGRRAGGHLRRLFRRAVVAAWRRSDQSRRGDAVACGRDRGQYRQRQYGRGRRHPDRARRPDPDRGAYPRHRGARPRPRHRRHRAEGRGETVRHRAPDGTASRREPQSGGCRTRGADYAGRPGHGVGRRYRQAARDRRCLEARRRHRADIPPPERRVAAAMPARPPIRRRTDCWPASTGSTA